MSRCCWVWWRISCHNVLTSRKPEQETFAIHLFLAIDRLYGVDFNKKSLLLDCLNELLLQNQNLNILQYFYNVFCWVSPTMYLFRLHDTIMGPELIQLSRSIADSKPAPLRELVLNFVGNVQQPRLVQDIFHPLTEKCNLYKLEW